MSFVVEDGTGKIDANSYTTVAFFRNYCLERGITTFDDSFDDEIKSALILGTDYIEIRFSNQIKGVKFNSSQMLSFPRVGLLNEAIDNFIYDVAPNDTTILGVEIPVKIQRATCEYAIRSKTAPLVNDATSDSMISQRVKIGQIEKETNFAANSKRPDMFNSFPAGDLLVKPYLKSNSGMVIR